MANVGVESSQVTSAKPLYLLGIIDVTKQATPVLPSNSAATNSTNIASIIAAAASGSTLYFPPGTYQFASAISPGTKAFIFQGAGSGQANSPSVIYTILETTSATADLFTLTDTYWYTEWRDLCFSTTINKTAGAIINTGTASGAGNVGTHVRRCNFCGNTGASTTLFNCIVLNGTASGNQMVIEGCTFTGFTNYAISVVGNTTTPATTASPYIHNCTVNGAGVAAAGIQVTQCGDMQIDDCDIIGCVNNLLCNPATGTSSGVFSIYCLNTFFDNSYGSCVKLTGTGNIMRCKFEACSMTVTGGATAYNAVEISTSGTTLATGIEFGDCTVFNTFSNSSTSSNGFSLTGIQDVSIKNCRIAGWLGSGITVTAGASSVTKLDIQTCIIGPTGGIAANGVGITLAAGTYGSQIICGNNLSGNTTAITDNTTVTTTANNNRYKNNNLGYNPLSTVAQPAVAASTTAVWNSTGVTCTVYVKGGTLTVITVGGVASGIAAAIGASDAYPILVAPNQQIAITYSVAPTWVWVGS